MSNSNIKEIKTIPKEIYEDFSRDVKEVLENFSGVDSYVICKVDYSGKVQYWFSGNELKMIGACEIVKKELLEGIDK